MSKRTSSSPLKNAGPKLTLDEQKGLRDYWQVYEVHREALMTELMRMVSSHSEFAAILQIEAGEQPSQQNNFELQRRAIIQNEWDSYLETLKTQGSMYAQMGLSLQVWFEMAEASRKYMLPLLLDTYGQKSDSRLIGSINGMNILIDLAMKLISSGYLNTKENMLRQELESAGSITKRKKTEDALRKQKNLYEAIAQAQSDLNHGFLLVEAERIIYTNDAYCRISGYKAAELAALPSFYMLAPPDELEVLKERFRRRMSGEDVPDHYETKIVHKKGHIVNVEMAVELLSMTDHTQLAIIVRDISDRKRAEEALQTSEQRFRALVEAGTDEIIILGADLKPLYSSPSVFRASGFSKEDFESLEPFGNVHPDEKAGVEKMFREFMKNPGQAQDYQVRLQHKDGSWRWVEGTAKNLLTDPSVAGILFNHRDVSERKQHMRELVSINTVSNALRSAPTRTDMLPVILDQVLNLLEIDAAGLSMRDPVSGEIVIELTRGTSASNTGRKIPAGQGISGHVISSGQPYISNNIHKDAFVSAHEPFGDMQAVGCIPLIAEGQTIGALWIARKNQIDSSEVRLLTSIGSIAANAIHRATLQEQTMQHMRHIAALHAIDVAISSSFDLEFVLNVMLDQVTNQLGVDAADILLLDPHLNTLEFGAGSGFRSKAIQLTEVRLGEGYAGRAALERRTISIHDLSTRDDGFIRPELISMEGFTTYYGVPLLSKGKIKGVLEIFHRKPLNPDQEWLDFLDTLAGQAAIAIADASLFNDLQRSNIELTIAYDATIEGWSRALDLRDKETEGHTQRVTEMTVRLARAMGLSDAELIHVRRGALLHDIGKMGIPDNILLKPDKLTDEEWAIMRKHPIYAYEMLSPIQFLRLAMDIPYSHHEKSDGTGYPRGLKGDEIPLTARIFAVVDIWDALRSDRPYRPAWDEEKILDYIHSLSGTHLDPQIVDAFLKLIGKF